MCGRLEEWRVLLPLVTPELTESGSCTSELPPAVRSVEKNKV